MKKLLLFVSILILAAFTALCTATAEDAVSSATLSVNALPQVQENENASVLVVYFSTDDILVNLLVNTFFCFVMTVFMTWFSLCVRGHAPIRAVPGGFLEMIGPVWVCCFFVSLFTQRPAISLAKKFS